MSEFWVRKMRTYFRKHDFDKDGIITSKDFDLMATHFFDAEKADSSTKEKGKKAAADFYHSFAKAAGVGSDKLTEDAFIESMKRQRNDPEFKKHLEGVSKIMFEIMDTNKDGYIQFEEYTRGFGNVGVADVSFTRKGFEAIDSNQDGKLSFDEIVNAYHQFFVSDDEKNPFSFMWGPLV